jgi:hypothetical protein
VCKITRKCKAVLLSDGFSLAEDVLEGLVAGLPEDATFRRVREEDGEDPRTTSQEVLKQIFDGGATAFESPTVDTATIDLDDEPRDYEGEAIT